MDAVGMRILVTAGPTREAIDPVRFMSNRSTGKMGFAVAGSALARGHAVRLISGPVAIQPPEGCEVVGVETAEQMLEAVIRNLDWCEALVMAAAVADWRPLTKSAGKLKKNTMSPRIDLERTPDILDSIKARKGPRLFVGFSADTDNVIEEAKRKLKSKHLDMIVANDVGKPGSGFGVETNEVTFICADGNVEALPLMTKKEAGDRIIEWIERYKA